MEGHKTRGLTNFSIDSIIGSTNGGREHKKFRPKNYQCPVCGMAFSNNGQLKNHVRIHTGERPFRCNLTSCGKAFTRNEELTRHKLIHTGARPHACPKCTKSFGRKDHLKKHVKTHERKKLRKSYFASPAERAAVRRNQSDTNRGAIDEKEQKQEAQRVPPLNGNLSSLASMTGLISSLSHNNPVQAQFNHQLAAIGKAPFLQMPTTPSAYIPPVTFALAQPSTMVATAIASSTTLNMFTPPVTTGTSLHHLTSDYWRKWYNFLSCYQQQ